MSAISTILARLRSAIWAIDVRDDIADAIEQCYSDVSNPTLQTDALEAAIQEKIDEGEMAALTIGDGTITAAKLAANAVTTPKIADGSITQAKLDPNIDFVQVDDTLSQEGEAADAAAVGAAIDELNGSLVERTTYEETQPTSEIEVSSAKGATPTEWTIDAFILRNGQLNPYYIDKLDVYAKQGITLKIGICSHTLYPLGSRPYRGKLTVTRWIDEFSTNDADHAIYEPETPIYIEHPDSQFVMIASSPETTLSRTNQIGNVNGYMGYGYGTFSLQRGSSSPFGSAQEGVEISTYVDLNHDYENPEEEPTETQSGYMPCYSMTYHLASESTTTYNVNTQVKNLNNAVKNIIERLDNPTVYNVLYGKKWVACGDSVTFGSQGTPYEEIIGVRNGMTVVNKGISGSTLMQTDANNPQKYSPFVNGVMQSISDGADYITIWYGINDKTQNGAIGTIADSSALTFYGAYNMALEYLIGRFPNAKIGIVISHAITEAYATAGRNIAKKYGLKVFDIPGDENIPYWHNTSAMSNDVDDSIKTARASAWFNDTLHPKTAGYEYISTAFEQWLRSL